MNYFTYRIRERLPGKWAEVRPSDSHERSRLSSLDSSFEVDERRKNWGKKDRRIESEKRDYGRSTITHKLSKEEFQFNNNCRDGCTRIRIYASS